MISFGRCWTETQETPLQTNRGVTRAILHVSYYPRWYTYILQLAPFGDGDGDGDGDGEHVRDGRTGQVHFLGCRLLVAAYIEIEPHSAGAK